jgi:hypothetical protein
MTLNTLNCGETPIISICYNGTGNGKRECGIDLKSNSGTPPIETIKKIELGATECASHSNASKHLSLKLDLRYFNGDIDILN